MGELANLENISKANLQEKAISKLKAKLNTPEALESLENLKEIKNLTIEVEKLSNKRLYKRLKNINKNDPKSDKYELQIKLIIDEYGRFLDVDIKNLENNYNNYINRFVKKILKKSEWSPSMTIFKDKNNNYRMERNSIFFYIHFIII